MTADVRQAKVDLVASTLHGSLVDPALESMNFLNEVASRYPDAISFASGRPCEQFFDVGLIHTYLDAFCEYLTTRAGYSEAKLNQTLFQYGRTKGIIHDLVARYLATDEGITVDPEAIVVTVGFQEAMFAVLRALRADERDVLLAAWPSYVGLTGAARLADLPVWPVRTGPDGVDLADLAAQADRARQAGLRPRACYVMPDFANPSGVSMSVPMRQRLLEVAEREQLLLIEDNPYGTVPRGTAPADAQGARHRAGRSSTSARSRRPASLAHGSASPWPTSWSATTGGSVSLLADDLSMIKSMITVNTSAVAQAVIGGKLLASDCSLARANERETATCTRQPAAAARRPRQEVPRRQRPAQAGELEHARTAASSRW